MNRVIKFRIWDIKNKLWITDYELDSISSWSQPLNSVFSDNKNCIFQQFTGLTDRNGKEIYEGDIILCPDLNPPEYSNTLSVVEYHGTCFCYRDLQNNKIEPIWDFIGLSDVDGDGEVIGNIFESSHLLK